MTSLATGADGDIDGVTGLANSCAETGFSVAGVNANRWGDSSADEIAWAAAERIDDAIRDNIE